MAIILSVQVSDKIAEKVDDLVTEQSERYNVRVTRSDILRQALTAYLAGLPVGNTGRDEHDD